MMHKLMIVIKDDLYYRVQINNNDWKLGWLPLDYDLISITPVEHKTMDLPSESGVTDFMKKVVAYDLGKKGYAIV
jgi:hypothetical protein